MQHEKLERLILNRKIATKMLPKDLTLIIKHHHIDSTVYLTLSRLRSLSYRNQSIDLHSKLRDWFLDDRDVRHQRVKLRYT